MRLSRKARVRRERSKKRKKLAIQMASILSMTTFGTAQVTNPSFALLYEQNHLQEHHLSAAFVFEKTIQELSEKSVALRLQNEALEADLKEISLQFNRMLQSFSFQASDPGTVIDDVYGSSSPSVTQDVYGTPSVPIDVYGPSPQDEQQLYDLLEKVFEIRRLIEENNQEMTGILDQLYTYYAQAEHEMTQAAAIYEGVLSMEGELTDEVATYHIEQARQQVAAAERVYQYIKVGLESVELDVVDATEQWSRVLRLIEEMERELRKLTGYTRPAPPRQEIEEPVEETEEQDEEQDKPESDEEQNEDVEGEQTGEDEPGDAEDGLENEEEQSENVEEQDKENVETEEQEEASNSEDENDHTEHAEQNAIHADTETNGKALEEASTDERLHPQEKRRNDRSGEQNDQNVHIGEPAYLVRNKEESTEEEDDQSLRGGA